LLLQKLEKEKPERQLVWAMGRLGSRQPIYGPVDRVVSVPEVEEWITRLLRLNLESTPGIAQALVALARATGDRARDVSRPVRESIEAWLQGVEGSVRLSQLLHDPNASLERSEEEWMFGEGLPTGLILHPES